jgi:hypothetical protein
MSVVEEKKVHIGDLHFELNLWLNEFKFYKDEIRIFNHRLEEIVTKNTGMEAMRDLEHFQNQYIRQIEVLDELRHEVKQHENALETEAKDHPIGIDHKFFEDHGELRGQVEQYKKIYYDLKTEFMRFLTKWM